MDENMKRWLLFLVAAFVIMQIFQVLQPPPEPVEEPTPATERSAGEMDLTTQTLATQRPDPATQPKTLLPEEPEEPVEEIVVETQVYRITFTTAGAYPVRWQIIDPEFAKAAQSDVEEAEKQGNDDLEVGGFMPIEIIPQYEGMVDERDYPLMTVLRETGGGYFEALNRRVYQHNVQPDAEGRLLVRLEEGDEAQTLVFRSPVTPAGIQMTKTFRFEPDSYVTHLQIRTENQGDQNLDFSEPDQPGLGVLWGPGIGSTHYVDRWDAGMYMVAAYDGKNMHHEKFKDWEKARPGAPIAELFEKGGYTWGMLESRFYVAAIAPKQGEAALIRGVVKGQYVPEREALRENMAHPITAEVYDGAFTLQPGDTLSSPYQIFVGPKQRRLLKDVDERYDLGLRKVPFHNSLWLIRVLAVFMMDLLGWLHDLTGNYGISIILLTLIMRLLTQPFTHIGMKSQARVMAEQKRIKPLIDAINEKYKDDPQKRNAETWKTYREHGVNPLAMFKGCIWLIIQMPIFFALYRLLMGAVDLRGESFLWIDDLTAPDALFPLPFTIPILGATTFNILPIMMGLSQVIAQRLQSSNMQDPNQKMMATFMPIMFMFILYNFAAGLSLYWFVSNLWQISFQIFVNKRVREEAERKAHKDFEDRQKTGPPKPGKKEQTKPGAREKFMAYLEKKTKEAEEMRRKKGK